LSIVSLKLGWIQKKDRAIAVSSTEAIGLCRGGAFERLSGVQATTALATIGPSDRLVVREFLAGLRMPRDSLKVDDRGAIALLGQLLKRGQIVVLRENEGKQPAALDPAIARRRLVRAIESQTRGRLGFAGRQYRLVTDLASLPDRESYEVVRRHDAEQVLDGLARQSGLELSGLLGQAKGQLTHNWRPPLQPDGLILVRRVLVRQASRAPAESAITPSQMKKLLKQTDWIKIEVVYEDGEPYSGPYRLLLSDQTTTSGNFDEEERVYDNQDIVTGTCKLFIDGRTAADDEDVAPTPPSCGTGTEDAPTEQTSEFAVTVVDELDRPVAGVPMFFRAAGADLPAVTGLDGIARCRLPTADSAQAGFASAEALAQLMRPIWAGCRNVERKDWVKSDDTTTTVTLFRGEVVEAKVEVPPAGTTGAKATIATFDGAATTPDNPAKLSVQPLVIVMRMLGEHFDTDKCFLLPKALSGVRDLVLLHRAYELTDLLIVGHTDTSATESYNLDLSLERTSAMRAYLTNDADAWLAWYGNDKKESKRWSTTEDNHMIGTLLADTAYPLTVLGYQHWHNTEALQTDGYEALEEDGVIGPLTRKQMILDYMHREDTTVPEGTSIVVHGCGEFFPLETSGETLDAAAVDGQHEQEDRRVEVFLFPQELGMLPPVPGETAAKGAEEYPEWWRRAIEIKSMTFIESTLRVRLHDGARAPMPKGTPYRYTTGGTPSATLASLADGWVEIPLPRNVCPERIRLEWGGSGSGGTFTYAEDLYVDCESGDEDVQARTKLHNLGYAVPTMDDLERAVTEFQADYGIVEHGLYHDHLPPQTRLKLWQIYATNCDARPSPPAAT
jgi:outer membrane protein OmpA-like peptidoglycan-associated protein